MKDKRLLFLSTENRRLIVLAGFFFLIVHVVLLVFRPHESWYDDAFWADWAYRISKGGYVTHVWGGGQPSYSPLYALIMALWYKVFGFSYFTAQLPNILFAFIAYLVICLDFEKGELFRSKWTIICFAFGYWVANGLFGIFTCGRVEVLCLLLGVLTLNAFFHFCTTKKTKYLLWFCVWSALQMATGFEGVLFTLVVLIVYSLCDIKQSFRQWKLYLWYALSSILSFVAVLAYMAMHNCAKAFLRTMFGFSYSIQSVIHFIETGQLSLESNVPINDTMTFWERINHLTIEGLFFNKEYLVFLVLVIALFMVMLYKKRKSMLSQMEHAMVLTSMFLPWFFILAGRYAWYYTWAAYVPCLISFCVLIEQTDTEKLFTPIVCVGICIWLVFSPDFKDRKRMDFKHEIDIQNIRDIERAVINPEESTYIPYKWYYYLATTNSNLYFEGSGCYPKNMTKMIFCKHKEAEQWKDVLELEYLYNINNYEVYKVLGDYGKHILR